MINIFGGGDPTGSAGENTFTLPGDHPHFIEEKEDPQYKRRENNNPQLKQKTSEDNQAAVESKTEKKMQEVEVVKPKPDSVDRYEFYRDSKGDAYIDKWRLPANGETGGRLLERKRDN